MTHSKKKLLEQLFKNKYNFKDINVNMWYMMNEKQKFIRFKFKINVEEFKIWLSLLDKSYTDHELSQYLIDVIRVKLPELKDDEVEIVRNKFQYDTII